MTVMDELTRGIVDENEDVLEVSTDRFNIGKSGRSIPTEFVRIYTEQS